jgi:hypothetical protein
MLPSWVTLVELSAATTFAAGTVLVCDSAVPSQDSATDEITAKYTLRFRFLLVFLSARFFTNFLWLNFFMHFRESCWDPPFAQCHEASRNYQFLENFRRSGLQRLKPTN